MTWRMTRLAQAAKGFGSAVRAEQARARSDSLWVAELKRRKLATRDEMALLEAGLLTRN